MNNKKRRPQGQTTPLNRTAKDDRPEGADSPGSEKHSQSRPIAYTLRQVAWIIGVPESWVSRRIRRGSIRAVRQRSGLLVPATEVARVLDLRGAHREP